MSTVIMEVVERQIAKRLEELLSNKDNSSINNINPQDVEWGGKGGKNIMSKNWHFFSTEELAVIALVETHSGLKQSELCAKAEQANPPINETTTRFILANLVKRNVLSSSPQKGYTLIK